MSREKSQPDNKGLEGFQPLSKGHQPMAITPRNPDQAGHQPTTGQGGSGPATPPSQGSSGKK